MGEVLIVKIFIGRPYRLTKEEYRVRALWEGGIVAIEVDLKGDHFPTGPDFLGIIYEFNTVG